MLNRSSAEFGLTVAAIPVVLLLLIACGIAVKREIKWLMTASLILMLGAQAYFLYKFSRLFIGQTRQQYVSTRATLAIVCEYLFLRDWEFVLTCETSHHFIRYDLRLIRRWPALFR